MKLVRESELSGQDRRRAADHKDIRIPCSGAASNAAHRLSRRTLRDAGPARARRPLAVGPPAAPGAPATLAASSCVPMSLAGDRLLEAAPAGAERVAELRQALGAEHQQQRTNRKAMWMGLSSPSWRTPIWLVVLASYAVRSADWIASSRLRDDHRPGGRRAAPAGGSTVTSRRVTPCRPPGTPMSAVPREVTANSVLGEGALSALEPQLVDRGPAAAAGGDRRSARRGRRRSAARRGRRSPDHARARGPGPSRR